jgi:hypothetical protein
VSRLYASPEERQRRAAANRQYLLTCAALAEHYADFLDATGALPWVAAERRFKAKAYREMAS